MRMIPKTKYQIIEDLVLHDPAVFYNTAMIGIFDGQDICSCFLNSANVLNTVTFYENFQDFNDESKYKLLELYDIWKKEIPNLEIKIGDGTSILETDDLDFLFTDAYNIDYTTYFLNKSFDNTLIAICGFGAELSRTVGLSIAIQNNGIFPIMLYKGFLFFTNNKPKYNEIYKKFKQFVVENNVPHVDRLGCIRPNGWYHGLLVDKE